MKLQVTFNATATAGITLSADVYITPRRLNVDWEAETASLLLDALLIDGDRASKLADQVFNQNYTISAWPAVLSALDGSTAMDTVIQNFTIGRINAVDPTAGIYDVENSVTIQ